MRTVVIILSIIVFLLIGITGYLYMNLPEFDPNISVEKIYSKKYNESIYLKKKNWGITGNHQVIAISTPPDGNPDLNKKTDFIFKGLSNLFYKFENDTLHIYTNKASDVPSNFSSNIEIN